MPTRSEQYPTTEPAVAADPSLAQFGYTPQLKRSLGLRDQILYGLVFMVVIAPFGIFGSVYSAAGGMIGLAYVVGAVAMLFTVLSYGHMVKEFPLAGSVYNYVRQAIGPAFGFQAGWTILLDYILVPTLLSLVAGAAMHATVPAVPIWAWMLAFVAVNTAINLLGIQVTKIATRWFLAAEVAVLAIFLFVAGQALLDGKAGPLTVARLVTPLYNEGTFTWAAVFGGASLAMLSFLGVDAISLLVEDARGGARQIRLAMMAALGVAATLFIAQTWVAALLVPNKGTLLADGDPAGTAFYDAAKIAGGPWLATLCAVATALAWGLANNMVAQVATSRLLFAMARDRQLPGVLARVLPRKAVPVNAVLLTATVSLGLGLYMASRDDGIAVLASLVNFGAICAFITLHVAVIWHYVFKLRSRNYLAHLVSPLIGTALLVVVACHADVLAQRVALIWCGAGLVVLTLLWLAGRRPTLSGLAEGPR